MKKKYENYGEDTDGNRGVKTLMCELEDTRQEREEIAELLYEKFLHRITGEVEIEYEDLTIEVKIEDYLKELVEIVKVDMDLEEECVHNIASELDDFDLIVDWKINKEKG